LRFTLVDQVIEPTTMLVETLLFISHLDSYLETALQVCIKVYEMGIDIIQEGALRSQTK
jgi:hypothetical protein